MKKLLFASLHKLIAFVAKSTAQIRAPWTKKNIQYSDVDLIQKCYLHEGDIILTRTNGWLSTMMIPGFWAHAAVYIGDGYIIDATTHGVQVRYLADLCMKADNVAILRPKYDRESQVVVVIKFCYEQLGKSYDFGMNLNDTSTFFCSELVMAALNKAKRGEFIEARETLGVPTFTPEDCYLARKKLDLIWEKLVK